MKLIIGEDESVRYIQDSVLRKSSKFFQAALKEQWTEGQECEVKLPEEEVEMVTTYLQWLYSDTVASKVQDQDKPSAYIYLSKLYVLGERLVDSEFQSRIIDAIMVNVREPVDGIHYNPIGKAINIVYENTPKSSPARQLMVETWFCHGKPHWLKESKAELNYEFVEDILTAFLGARKRPARGGERSSALYDDSVPHAYYKQD